MALFGAGRSASRCHNPPPAKPPRRGLRIRRFLPCAVLPPPQRQNSARDAQQQPPPANPTSPPQPPPPLKPRSTETTNPKRTPSPTPPPDPSPRQRTKTCPCVPIPHPASAASDRPANPPPTGSAARDLFPTPSR